MILENIKTFLLGFYMNHAEEKYVSIEVLLLISFIYFFIHNLCDL